MNHVLLTVSGTIDTDIDAQIEQGARPEADYVAMASAFGADLLDYHRARQGKGFVARLLEKLGGPALLLAWRCFQLRDRYQVIFTDGEQVGMPLALLLKTTRHRPKHFMIGHIVSVAKKRLLLDWFRLYEQIDRFFVYATWQKQFIESRWQVPAERVIFTPFMVDADFFSPERLNGTPPPVAVDISKPLICAVGLEFRDYPTLLEAVREMDVQVVIAAASPWSKRSDTTAGQEIPDNVIVQRFTQFELRQLYALSRFVVVPLYEVEFQAGVTTLLEAMAMEKAVICTRTSGQTDVVVEGETGLYVPPQDAEALRAAIEHLLQHPEEAARLGAAGRQRIESEMSLERYAARLGGYVREAIRTNG